jgi:tetratricopeptide (TPR) repeat protein
MNLSVGCALALLLPRMTEASRVSVATLARRTWWLAAVIVLGLATVSLSLTRGGTFAILASAAVATLVLLASRNLRQMAGVMALLLLSALALLFYHGFERVYARMFEPGFEGRVQMIRDTLAMYRTFPTAGVGLGAFEWIFPMFDRSFAPSTATYVENEYLQTLVDTGPLGLAAVVLFVGVIALRYVRAIRNDEDQRIGLAAAGLGYGLVAVMVHSLSDFGQHLPAIACLSAVTCGLLFNLGQRRGGRTIRLGRGFGALALVVVVAISSWGLIGATRAWQGERKWVRARTMLNGEDWRGTAEEYAALVTLADEAIAAEPDNARRRYWASVYRWRWLRTQADETTGRTPLNEQTIAAAERIIAELNEARRRAPTYGLPYSILGQIELNFLNRPIGYDHIQAGYRLSRNDAYATFVAGQADVYRGDFASARQKMNEAVRIDNEMADDVIELYLSEDVDRPALAADAIGDHFLLLIRLRDALRKDPRWRDLAEQAEDRAFAVLIAETQRPGGATAWKFSMIADWHHGRERYAQAEQYYARALLGDPTHLHWRCHRAEVLHKLGRTREALEEARLALQQHPNAPEAKKLIETLTGGTP